MWTRKSVVRETKPATITHAHDFTEVTVKECLTELGREEAQDAERGVLQPHEVTASGFLATGLELEEQQ